MKPWWNYGASPEFGPRRSVVAATGGVLFVAAAAPPLAAWLEATLVRHVLVQVPMLVVSGVALSRLVAGRAVAARRSAASAGVPAILIAFFTIAFWMLPRWLDAARADPLTDMVKIVSLALLAGFPLGLGLPRLPTVVKAFVWANVISMLSLLGWLYLTFPSRLCINYLLSEQRALGEAMLALAGALGVIGTGLALFGRVGPPSADIGSRKGDRFEDEAMRRVKEFLVANRPPGTAA